MKNPLDRSRLKLIVLAGAIVIAVILDVFIISTAFSGFHSGQSDSAFQMLLIWLVGWLIPAALVAFFIFQLLKYQRPFLAQAICLIAVTLNLILIFSVCPMELSSQPKEFEHHPPGVAYDSTAAKFLIEENKKAVEEIKARDEEEDSWFHNKFILVGALLAATMGYIGFGKHSPRQSTEQELIALSKSPSTAVILALASVMALGVDMHVRGNTCEVDQLGLWIRYYVEPVMLHGNSDRNGPMSLPENFHGWEDFLRAKVVPATNVANKNSSTEGGTERCSATKSVYWDPETGSGKHSGELWNLFYEPHIHFLTAFVYVLYLAVFQTFALSRESGRGSARRGMPIVCFAVVQASFLAFAWIAHSAPEMFELKVLPFIPAYEAGYFAPLHYFVPCLALILLNTPYLAGYWGKSSPLSSLSSS
jgi:hypothetical protein